MGIRANIISKPLMKAVKGVLPAISETERIALEAGTVGWDADLLSGAPDWQALRDFKVKPLTAEEQSFLDVQVRTLCDMVSDWEFNQKRDLPKKAWDYLKKEKFFGMVISKKEGGLGFSAAAHAAVVTKIATHSVGLAVMVMVPNSLGPGELLHRYGTKEQKKYYMPRLADGRDIPCFALTEPHAGSDAANGQSFGIVCKGAYGGKKDVLGIKLTFNKRYITLAPIATVVGLAFNLRDPDELLGDKKDIGITCALLPHDIKGLNIGERHDPMGIPFPNGNLDGKDVFIPMDMVIGGVGQVGNGWRMLMECLAAGRGISLPSLSVGASQLVALSTASYGRLRHQFGMPIGNFEGIRERTGRIAGLTYALTATRWLTAGYIDAGENPAVLSAIAKEKLTETMRMLVNDGMDIFGGAAIIRGPRNILGRGYTSIPIAITVEGANILTRSLITFGQGAMRSHPHLQREVTALYAGDLEGFDDAFWKHVGHALKAWMRGKWSTLTRNRLMKTGLPEPLNRMAQDASYLSARLAWQTEMALLILGGDLKRKEYLSGRYADAFSWLYILSASIKYAHHNGMTANDMLCLRWVHAYATHEAEKALLGVLDNIKREGPVARGLAGLTKLTMFPLGARFKAPEDKLTDKLAGALSNAQSGMTEHLTDMVHRPAGSTPGLGALLAAAEAWEGVGDIIKAIKGAQRAKKLPKGSPLRMAEAALAAKVIDKAEHGRLVKALALQDDVVQVDSFAWDAYKELR